MQAAPSGWRLFFSREVLGVVTAILSVCVLTFLTYKALELSGVWSWAQ